jgi:hypothetical protein
MKCEDFETNVSDLGRAQIVPASVRAQALAHCDECEACARRLEEENALSYKLRALASEINAVSIPALRSDLLAALSNRQPVTILPANRIAWSHRKTIAGALAVAAMILIVVTVTIIRSRSTTPAAINHAQIPADNNQIARAPDQITKSLPLLPPTNASSAERKNIHRRANRSALPSQHVAKIDNKNPATTESPAVITSNSDTEITTDFMPVGYASASTLQDGGQLVRVELPRSALVAFGLPMNMNRSDEKVKADVFFGMDGTAHAIRFVQ